ncbi:MAG: UDP-N-acetylglucosamine 1-carboxyvinyltransferase [Patescibacteria group bacterium]
MNGTSTDRILIRGLGGKRQLSGRVPVYGAKNQAIKCIAASILYETPLFLSNMPDIADVLRMNEILETLGVLVERKDKREYRLDSRYVSRFGIDSNLGSRLRASVVVSGPLLARFGKVSFPHPGGDIIGTRPIDLFLNGFRAMGAKVEDKTGEYQISAPRGLRGARIVFPIVSVTATETLMMAATLAKGKTILENSAMEPEITALAEMLNYSGAEIEGAGTPRITIKGGRLLRSKRTFKMIPDRIETGSFLVLAALAGKKVKIEDCMPEHLSVFLSLLSGSGVPMSLTNDSIEVYGDKIKKGGLKAFNIKTHEYPGFATDLQTPSIVYLTQTVGEGHVFETVFDGRLSFVGELNRMGADISEWNPHEVIIKGPTPLSGRTLSSPDIRAGLAFLIAGIVAKGESRIDNVYHIDRGYEAVEERLQSIGAAVERVK